MPRIVKGNHKVTLTQATEILGLGRQTVIHMIATGEIEGDIISGRVATKNQWKIDFVSLMDWLAKQRRDWLVKQSKKQT